MFTDVFDDASVFISFDPTGPNSGRTDSVGGREVTIGASEFRISRWSVAATIRSEFKRASGAAPTDTLAVRSVRLT